MKTKIIVLLVLSFCITSVYPVFAESKERVVPSFSEVSLRIPGKLYIEQGKKQSVEIVAKSSTLGKIITEVKDRKLIIRFSKKSYLWNRFDAGKIEIFISVPEIDGLSISGSGDIIADKKISTRILDLAISGSGDIKLDELKAERVKTNISGSGDIYVEDGGVAHELSVSISGSGNVKAANFKTKDVEVKTAGSGNVWINAINSIKVRIAGSGNVYYRGSPSIDSSIAGSGDIKQMK